MSKDILALLQEQSPAFSKGQHRIAKFALAAMITGVVRTAVVFWMPTYISQALGFSPDRAASIFAASPL